MIVQVSIRGLVVDTHSESPVLILQEENGERILPIWIGEEEAFSISMALTKTKSERPLTHDLTISIFQQLGIEFCKVIIHQIIDNTYHCQLILESRERLLQIDARPSDAVALALRAKAPIYVMDKVFNSISPFSQSIENNSIDYFERIKNRLNNLNPEYFGDLWI